MPPWKPPNPPWKPPPWKVANADDGLAEISAIIDAPSAVTIAFDSLRIFRLQKSAPLRARHRLAFRPTPRRARPNACRQKTPGGGAFFDHDPMMSSAQARLGFKPRAPRA